MSTPPQTPVRTGRAGLGAALAAALGLLGSASCGDGSTQSGALGGLTPQTLVAMVDLLQTAPFTTAHEGVRRVERRYEVLGTPTVLVYTERIVTDGQGNYAIDPLSADSPVPTGFLTLQKSREGYFYLYRDFLVRDADLFLDNYQITDMGPDGEGLTVFVAGRECRQFEARRTGSDGHVYTAAFDLATGIVLSYSEHDAQGSLLSSMTYESFDETPDLGSVVFHQPDNLRKLIDMQLDVPRQLGFAPRVPTWEPPGYERVRESRIVDLLGEPWLELAYTDGVETLFFLHTAVAEGTTLPKPVEKGLLGVSKPQVTVGDASSPEGSTSPSGEVYTIEIGPLSVVQGVVAGRQVIALGKVPTEDLLEMIESALN